MKLFRYWISFSWIMKGRSNWPPTENSAIKTPSLIRVKQQHLGGVKKALLIIACNTLAMRHSTAKFSIENFYSKCDQICSCLWIWLHVLKKSLIAIFIIVQCVGMRIPLTFCIFQEWHFCTLWRAHMVSKRSLRIVFELNRL